MEKLQNNIINSQVSRALNQKLAGSVGGMDAQRKRSGQKLSHFKQQLS